MYRKLVLVFAAVFFSNNVFMQIGVSLVSSIIFMLYIVTYWPMHNTFSNYVVVYHEIAIYLCSILTLVFSDVITSTDIRFKVANVWVIIIIFTFVLDTVSLILGMVFKSKRTLEIFAYEFRRERLRR